MSITLQIDMTYDIIEKFLHHFFSQIGWDTNYSLKLEGDVNTEHLFEAYVDLNKWIINFKYPPKVLELFETLQKENSLYKLYESGNLIAPVYKRIDLKTSKNFLYPTELYNFLAGISFHEFGHSKECPIDTHYFSIIVQAVNTVLEQKQVYSNKLSNYIVNLFCDIIVNSIFGLNIDNAFFRNSLFTLYFSELLQFDSTDISFYFFILLNLKMFQFHIPIRRALESLLLPKLPQNYLEVFDKLLIIFCPYNEINQNLKLGVNPTEDERWKIINYLSERDNWDQMAYKFTEIIYEFISEEEIEDHQPVPDFKFMKEFIENEAFQKEVLEKIIERKIEGKSIKKKNFESNISPQSNGSIEERYPGEFEMDVGFGHCGDVKFYDSLYRYRTKKIDIFLPKSKDDYKHTLTWLNREIMTDRDNIVNFDPFNVFFLPNSDDLLLFKKSVPLTTNQDGIINEKGFPNLAILCDDSGSMDWNPTTGEGKYDALIITIYSLMSWLRTKEFAPVIKYNFTFFSTTSRSTNWIDYYHLDDIKPLLFYHEGGGTLLDRDVFLKIVKDPKRKAIMLITDGEISNFKEILKILKEYKNNMVFLFIQIGRTSEFGRKLKTQGFNITEIKNINHLSIIVLNFIKKTYENL